MSDLVQIRPGPDESYVEIVLNRPDKLNALTLAMLEALGNAARAIPIDGPTPSVVVLRSSSTRAFSVGADIKEWATFDPLEASRASRVGVDALNQVADIAAPTIAAIQGHCLGGGLEVALSCDLRVVDATAQLGFPEATVGTGTGWGGLPRLVALVGPARAKHLLLTGRTVDAQEAMELGVVNVVAGAGEFDSTLATLVQQLAATAPIATRTMKRLIDDLCAPSRSGFHAESLSAALYASTNDARRGKEAFDARTTPEFHGE